jgi:hypothetical protein
VPFRHPGPGIDRSFAAEYEFICKARDLSG